MNTATGLLDTVKELVQSEDLVNNPALANDLKALLAKHQLLEVPRFTPNILDPEQTLLHTFDRFIHDEICKDNPTLIHGVRSSLRNYVLPNFGFSPAELRKLDIALSKIPVKDFRGIEDIFIANTKVPLESK